MARVGTMSLGDTTAVVTAPVAVPLPMSTCPLGVNLTGYNVNQPGGCQCPAGYGWDTSINQCDVAAAPVVAISNTAPVTALSCPVGSTCTYLSNVPDMFGYLGLAAAAAFFVMRQH
jgi:hypothetical protein